MEQVFIVPSKMMPVGRIRKKSVPTGNAKKVLGGLFSVNETEVHEEFEQTGQSDCQVDTQALALDVETKLQELAAAGFAVINITPIISGAYAYKSEWSARYHAGYGYGYGFSYTAGMMIVARKMPSSQQENKPIQDRSVSAP